MIIRKSFRQRNNQDKNYFFINTLFNSAFFLMFSYMQLAKSNNFIYVGQKKKGYSSSFLLSWILAF